MNVRSSQLSPLWHSLSPEQVLHELNTAPGGHPRSQPTASAATTRASAALPAAIPQRPDLRAAGFGRDHRDLLGHAVDTGVILGVVVINAIVGFVQEGKAESALAAIRKMLSLQSHGAARRPAPGNSCRRSGSGRLGAAAIGRQGAGRSAADRNQEPADQEAVLTGEAEAVEKSIAPVAAEAAIGDRTDMAYSGTWSITVRARRGGGHRRTPPKSAASAPCWNRWKHRPRRCCGRWPNSAAG
jgi:hypothetical protein